MKFYPIHMHLHASHEPTASIGAHMSHAAELGIKHMFITEHDTRMGEKKRAMNEFRFTEPSLFFETENGIRAGFKHVKDEGGSYIFSENGENFSLEITADKGGYEEFYFYSATKAHSDPLFSDISVDMDADISLLGNARLSVEFILSAQPPTYKQAKLIYVLGEIPDLHENTAYCKFPNKSEDGLYHFNLTSDTSDAVGGLDNALCYINIILEGRMGEGKISFRSFKFNRKLDFEPVRQRQIGIAEELGKKWGVTPFVTFEISGAGHHRNCYTTTVPCINYKELGYRVTGEYAVNHVKDHGGIFSYNHPFTEWKRDGLSEEEKIRVVDELIEKFSENKVEGAALMEVGFPYEKEDFYDRHYLRLYDGLAAKGVFITADGDSDNHHATDSGWKKGNNFATFAGLYYNEEPRESDFTRAFMRGSCWCGNPLLIKNMHLCANNQFTFGSIFVNENAEIEFRASGISCEGYAVRIVNGIEDRKVEIKNGEVSDSYILKPSLRFNFVRYEIRDSEGILIALSNPVYSVQDRADVYSDAEKRIADTGDYACRVERYEKSIDDGKKFYEDHPGTRVLHIGDTRAEHYSYYKRMISEFKPDIIIHTGDLADELKAGRIDADKLLWQQTVPDIIEIMRRSGARCIIVPGNNDIRDKLYTLAEGMEILPRNRVIDICGTKVCVNHEVMKIDETLDVDIHLYGHGLTGESRTEYDNVRAGKKYFNTSWGSSLHVFESDSHLIIPEIRI